MKTRIVLQDNLWFRAAPRFSNYRLKGRTMIPVEPRLGLTASSDTAAKTQELRWLQQYTGERGQGVVISQEWIRPGDLVDTNLRRHWLPLFQRQAPAGRWCVFYDPILAARQRGLLARGKRPDYERQELFTMFRRDLDYLASYFERRQYWRLGGRPVLQVWATFALKNARRIYRLARQRGIYLLADTLGASTFPEQAPGLTGFTAALPEMPRRTHRLVDLLPTYRAAYDRLAAISGRDFIPAGSCQFDDSAFMSARRLGEKPLRVIARHRGDVEAFLRLALRYSRPLEGTRYLVWGTLNNWAEGTTVLPTASRGRRFPGRRVGNYRFAHLEAINRIVFGG